MEIEYQEKEWENQTGNALISLTQFINRFQQQTKYQMNKLNERLDMLENQIANMENRIVCVVPNSNVSQIGASSTNEAP